MSLASSFSTNSRASGISAALLITTLLAAGCDAEVLRADDDGQGGSGASPGGGDGGDDGEDVEPEPWVDPTCGADGIGTVAGLRSAIAVRNAGDDSVEVLLTDTELTTCDDPLGFPEECVDAYRVRFYLDASQLTPGTYSLGSESQVWAYRDAQGGCDPFLGGDISGQLTLYEASNGIVRGTICGTGVADGTFTATLCANSCQSVGDPCVSDGQCCTNFCFQGSCDP